MKANIFLTVLVFVCSLFCEVNAQNIYTFAGNGTQGYSGDGGNAALAELYYPEGVAVDGSGNIYIVDFNNFRIRKVAASGTITTIAGNGMQSCTGDGGPAINAQFKRPTGVCCDAAGNVYIVDQACHQVRKINSSGVITTFAGNGTLAYAGDGGLAINASFDNPTGVCTDGSGNIYIADRSNNVIRKVNTSGIISTFAGNGTQGFSGDGGLATSAQLNNPKYVTADAAGNIYISDEANYRIRKVTTTGIISTYAGTGNMGFSGDGGPSVNADIYWGPIACDTAGNLYLGDVARIRKITKSGTITTIAGTGTPGFSGDGGPAINAMVNDAKGITVDAANNIYFSASGDHRVREICVNACLVNINALETAKHSIISYPNPNRGDFTLNIDGDLEKGELTLYNSLGIRIYFQNVYKGENLVTLNLMPAGLYQCIIVQEGKNIYNRKIIIE